MKSSRTAKTGSSRRREPRVSALRSLRWSVVALTFLTASAARDVARAEPTRLGYINHIPPESRAARKARHQKVAERRAGTPILLHRGAHRFAPENTLEAYAAAMDHGADGCEIDIHRTRDGVLVLHHDDKLGRTIEGSGRIKDLTYYEILGCPVKGAADPQTRMPTLASLLVLARQRAMLLHLDIKAPGLEQDIRRMLDEADVWDHVVRINDYNSAELRKDPRLKLLDYKGWIEEAGEGERLREFLGRPQQMIFTKYDPARALKAIGRPWENSRPVPLPEGIRVEWGPEGLPTSRAANRPGSERLWVYVGTYTNTRKSKGIYLFEMDARSGKLDSKGLAGEAANPSFLAIHPNRKFLYAVGELSEFEGKKAGAVSAFSIDPAGGELSLLNQRVSGGTGACHVSIHPSGRHVAVANYGSGSVATLPIDETGRLGEPTSIIQHVGSGPDSRRQTGPHAHSIHFDAAGRYVFAADLGIDKILIYRFDAASGRLTPNEPSSVSTVPGGGPRHFAFHPSGRFAYTNSEMGCSVTAFAYDADAGALREIQTVGALPLGWDGQNTTAEVQVHSSGKFLYCSNRGHDSIATFTIDQKTGRLTPVGHESTQGKTPRNFGIDPTDRWLIAANQASDNLVVFRIDAQTGRLEPSGTVAQAPTPVCVKFMPAP